MSLLILAPHAIGLGGLPWLMMSELFPTKIRARAVSVTTTFLWFAGFTGPLAFPKLTAISNHSIGSPAGIFWMYAVIAFLAFIFGIKMLPETKGRTLESIAKSWEKKK
jgi:SP family arabinose:H+ symporter-like MFS transporter